MLVVVGIADTNTTVDRQLCVGRVLRGRLRPNRNLVSPVFETYDGDAGFVVLPGPELGDRTVMESFPVADVDSDEIVGLVRQSGQVGGHLPQFALDGNRRTRLFVESRFVGSPVAEAPFLNLRTASGKDIAFDRRRRVPHVARLACQEIRLSLLERAEGLRFAFDHLSVDPGIDIARIAVSCLQVGKRNLKRIAILRGYLRENPIGRDFVEITYAPLRTDAFNVADANGTSVADLLDAGCFHDVDTFGLVVVAGACEERAGC